MDRAFTADSRAEAVADFRAKHPSYQITEVDGEGIIGYDEDTFEPIFVDDDYISDDEGVMVLRKNLTDETIKSLLS